jgi:DNA-binding SARP family transcriptional activator/tetratricopeptide (TPR) repeat protein
VAGGAKAGRSDRLASSVVRQEDERLAAARPCPAPQNYTGTAMNRPLLSTQALPHIELLGAPRLVLPDGSPHILERRDAALLAWLALHGPTPRHRLVGLLWPDLPARTAQTNLRQRLFRLKQRTGREIVVSGPVLALADDVSHDLQPNPSAPFPPAVQGAASLLGDLDYDDCSELADWVAGARERWAAACREQLARHAAELEAAGRIAEALAFAQRLTLEAPTAEHAHRRVMRLHYRRGDRAAALTAFARCQEALGRELGTRPGVETRELAALIERSDALPPAVAAPTPLATLRPPRLIGREVEWRAIETAWQCRQPVLLRGEPGIGKSRLALDFVSAQGQPHAYRAHAGDVQVPYSLLARVLRGLSERFGTALPAWATAEFARLLPELGPQPPGKLEPLRLRQAVVEAMRCWQANGLEGLVIDDLHFADEASLEWLLGWLEHGQPLQLVATVRGGEMPRSLSDWLRRNDLSGVCEVALAPLGVEAIEALLASLSIPGLDSAAWAGPLARHTGGNPLFILETLKSQVAGAHGALPAPGKALAAPAHIGKMLEQRLERLPAEALRLARLAAIAGVDFSAELAAGVLGCHALDLAEPWAALERAQVIADGAFAHDLILEATLHSVPEAIAVTLHGAIAHLLEGGGRASARVAHHWQAAREWARAAPCFEAAARAAQAASRPAEALEMWDRAAACHAQAGIRDAAFACRSQAIEPAIAVGPSERVQERIDSLLTDARTDSERLSALLAHAKHVATAADFSNAVRLSAEALALARAIADRKREVMALNLHGLALANTGQVAQGLPLFEAMAHRAGEAGDHEVECEFWGFYAYALLSGGRFHDAAAGFQRAAEMAEALGDVHNCAIYTGNLSSALGYLGQTDRALDAALRAQALQARLGELRGEPYIVSLLNVGMCSIPAGQFARGLAAFEEGLRICREGKTAHLPHAFENHLASTYVRLGQPARARQVLSALTPTASPATQARRQIIDWRIRSFAGPVDAESLTRALDEFGGRVNAIDRFGLQLAVAAALSPDEALSFGRRVREEALETAQSGVALTALIRLANAEHRCGRHSDAAASARQAVIERENSSHFDLPVPEFWWVCFEALDSADRADEALEALRCGVDWTNRSLAHVPEAFRESYRHRSQIVPKLLAMGAHRLVG